jgi:hypothetical protein
MSAATWSLMLLALAGSPPPAIPGRQHKAPPGTDADPFADEWDRRTKPATPATLIDSQDSTD